MDKPRLLEGLLASVAVAANEASGADEAIEHALREICRHTQWPVGHAYRVRDGALESTGVWFVEDEREFGEFKRVTASSRFGPDEGLPGRAWKSGTTSWIPDALEDPGFLRTPAAAKVGLRSCFAFPIWVEGEITEILEFFSRETMGPDGAFMSTVAVVGSQLGLVIQRLRATRALEASEERFRRVFDESPMGMALVAPDFRLSETNRAFCQITGYTSEELAALTFVDITHPEDVEKDVDLAARLFSGEIPSYRIEKRYIRKGGAIVWIHLTAAIVRDPDGRAVSGLALVEDITERKRAEEAVLDAYERERQAARRLRELDQLKNTFIGMVAHDIRTPMTVIQGYAGSMSERWDSIPDETKHEFVTAIEAQVQAMAGLVDDVLEVAQLESGQLEFRSETFILNELIERAVDEVLLAYPGRHCEVAGSDSVVCSGDMARYHQVLGNLLTNALKFSPEDVPVEVRVAETQDHAVIEVVDHGIGIKEEGLPRVFDRFSRVEQPGEQPFVKGTGLGLYICKSFVEQQGGRIWVESEVGSGSTFAFTVPKAR